MNEPVIETVDVPGARLHTETRGAGPLLLCIVGGNGDAESFGRVAPALAPQFTVVSYDRRGFARSPLDGPVGDDDRLAHDVDDAIRLIDRHGGPAYVLGSSSGAIVGLALLARAPDRVRLLVAHEPPLVTLLPDGARWLAAFDHVHATYLASGVEPAMAEFGATIGLGIPQTAPPGVRLPPEIAAMLARMRANQAFWLDHELRQYPRVAPDLPALRAARGQLALGVGREPPGALLTQPARRLAAAVDAPVAEFAGGHVGYLTNAAEFAAELAALLTDGPRRGAP